MFWQRRNEKKSETVVIGTVKYFWLALILQLFLLIFVHLCFLFACYIFIFPMHFWTQYLLFNVAFFPSFRFELQLLCRYLVDNFQLHYKISFSLTVTFICWNRCDEVYKLVSILCCTKYPSKVSSFSTCLKLVSIVTENCRRDKQPLTAVLSYLCVWSLNSYSSKNFRTWVQKTWHFLFALLKKFLLKTNAKSNRWNYEEKFNILEMGQ